MVQFLLRTCIEEEPNDDGYIENKIFVCETIMNTSVTELRNHGKDEIIKSETSTIVDDIKTDPSSTEACHSIVNSNVIVKDEISVVDIKIESDNGFYICHHCHGHYEDYCTKCGALFHILNRIGFINIENGKRQGVPNNILEIRDSSQHSGTFALKIIPVGVKFGPFNGLNVAADCLRLKGGKFVMSEDKSKLLNWMQYINPARTVLEQNLLAFQCEGNLYYRSVREIQASEELLVYFGDEYEESLNKNVEVSFVPPAEDDAKDVFACTFCCLGFSSNIYLAHHKSICPSNIGGKFSIEELTQCNYCNFFLDKNEYLEYHRIHCHETSNRQCTQPVHDSQMCRAKRSKTERSQVHKCTHCGYKTKYRGDLRNHANQHYQVKTYKCGTCCDKRFKAKESLKAHMENMHVKIEGTKTQKCPKSDDSKIDRRTTHSKTLFKCSTCDFRTKDKYYLNKHVKIKHLKTIDYKCVLCGYESSRKQTLDNHMRTKHLGQFNYKCELCQFKTNYRRYLEAHVKTKHLKEFDYVCELCRYKSNEKFQLERHVKTKHLKEFNYECESCKYKTNKKTNLDMHVKTKHLEEFNFMCNLCKYKTNYKKDFEVHVKSRHLDQFDYKCEKCAYKTNEKQLLEMHIKTKHLKEFDYKCEICEYKTNQYRNLERHTKSKHLKEFNFGCDQCNFKSNDKRDLERHVRSKHLKEFSYRCETCAYKTNHKQDFELHTQTKHFHEYKYKCESCEYRTSHKRNFERHTKTKHLKEFNYRCEACDYKSNTKTHLKKHVKSVHLKEFSHQCQLCVYKTNYKRDFEIHTKTKHLKEFDYKCDICEYKTNKKLYFDRHIKSKHLKEFNYAE